jgi:hypothetical protein
VMPLLRAEGGEEESQFGLVVPEDVQKIFALPVIADTAGYLHENAVRLLYHAATVKASGNVDNKGLIGRAREDHRFGFRRANTRPQLRGQRTNSRNNIY